MYVCVCVNLVIKLRNWTDQQHIVNVKQWHKKKQKASRDNGRMGDGWRYLVQKIRGIANELALRLCVYGVKDCMKHVSVCSVNNNNTL